MPACCWSSAFRSPPVRHRLYFRRHKLDDDLTHATYGFLYNGFKPSFYWWVWNHRAARRAPQAASSGGDGEAAGMGKGRRGEGGS